jgi:hypothetical protein
LTLQEDPVDCGLYTPPRLVWAVSQAGHDGTNIQLKMGEVMHVEFVRGSAFLDCGHLASMR